LYGGEKTPALPILIRAIGRGGKQNPSVLPETVLFGTKYGSSIPPEKADTSHLLRRGSVEPRD